MFNKTDGYEVVRAASQEDLEESTPLNSEDEKLDSESVLPHHSQKAAFSRLWPWTSVAINAFFLAAIFWLYLRLRSFQSPLPPYPDLVYSPVQHLVQYEQLTFVDGLRFLDGKPRSVYLGPPTEESDAAWDELYDIGGISQIPASEAAKLSEPTARVLDEPGDYFVGLDVFHQLHCLNWVRKRLRPERYGLEMDGFTDEQRSESFVHTGKPPLMSGHYPLQEDVPLTDTTLDHCIDSIRQSLMCSADVSPVIWHWRKSGFKQDMNNTHVCRDFDKIKGWTKEHMLTREINSRLPEDQVMDIVAAASSN